MGYLKKGTIDCMPTGWIDLSRGDYMDNGVSPRQRKLHILRWNPAISSYTEDDFKSDLEWFKDGAPVDSDKWGQDRNIYWTVYDWKDVEYMDLFVMIRVGDCGTGIVGAGYLHSYPLQEQKPDGSLGRTRFFKLSYMFMQDPTKTGLLTGEQLVSAIPIVDWLHGHSGELVSVENAEQLALFMVGQLKTQENGDFLMFEDFNEKKYVLSDIMTFLCPELKKKLLSMGRNTSPEVTDINNLMVTIKDKAYHTWRNLERHLQLEELNGIMM